MVLREHDGSVFLAYRDQVTHGRCRARPTAVANIGDKQAPRRLCKGQRLE